MGKKGGCEHANGQRDEEWATKALHVRDRGHKVTVAALSLSASDLGTNHNGTRAPTTHQSGAWAQHELKNLTGLGPESGVTPQHELGPTKPQNGPSPKPRVKPQHEPSLTTRHTTHSSLRITPTLSLSDSNDLSLLPLYHP